MNIYLTRLKVLFRDRANLFWAFLFPIFLGIFFQLGFGSLNLDSPAETINVYIASDSIDESDFSIQLISTMESLKIKEDIPLFELVKTKEKTDLEENLLDGSIVAYLDIDSINESVTIHLTRNGVNQTIQKAFLDQYLQVTTLVKVVGSTDPANIAKVINDLENAPDFLVNEKLGINSSGNNLIIYFYSLIAMVCLYSSLWGLVMVKDIQANQTPLALRVNVTPTPKARLVLIYFLASLTIGFIGNATFVLFLKYILSVELGNLFLVLLIVFVGTISGISLGGIISVFVKGTPDKKEGIISAVSLLLSAMSGLMVVYVKYLITSNAPILGYINPANLLTEGLYSLYYYKELDKYYFNLILLSILSAIMLIVTMIKIRGDKYDSI